MRLFLLPLAAVSLFAASIQEPSAFGAGNLDSPQPYGLTDDQKHILANKRAIEVLQKRVIQQQQIIERNSERIDGLQSILEGLTQKLHTYDQSLKETADINGSLEELAQSQSRNFEQIRNVLTEMGAMIDSINAKYVDKERFGQLEKAFLDFKKSYESYAKKASFSGKSNASIFVEAKKAFARGHYDDAKRGFLHLIKKHYKPATSNYYLGEIAYRQGRYKDAIAYYKKSASLYDKSSFMPTLLFHTGVSFQRLGDKKQAREFYQSVIALYPKTKSARLAKSYLAKLK
ncbi:MAG: tetratricopeptide repeat protein [Epsilonproteobacteria bacterium]|nr:tetratricopeptide repeat protein [Campylobacterota bacterium]